MNGPLTLSETTPGGVSFRLGAEGETLTRSNEAMKNIVVQIGVDFF
jgi:hypothetical protein